MRIVTRLIVSGLLLFPFTLSAVADCPTTSICPEDSQTGNPTGQYKWQEAVELSQGSHPTMDDKRHVWTHD
jgi:hypothetical protein